MRRVSEGSLGERLRRRRWNELRAAQRDHGDVTQTPQRRHHALGLARHQAHVPQPAFADHVLDPLAFRAASGQQECDIVALRKQGRGPLLPGLLISALILACVVALSPDENMRTFAKQLIVVLTIVVVIATSEPAKCSRPSVSPAGSGCARRARRPPAP